MVDFTPTFLQFIGEWESERIINIGSTFAKVIKQNMHMHFHGPQCSSICHNVIPGEQLFN